ncbi:hypothetical protein [Novosphingobium sp. SG720]|uniref:hypothetical protein n=1 Tax=Novosphingobium sp. SG720 TaxID=2586998 RepID=UPI0017C43712|nr:hypothetical protein [Novosphingobium sp. SG720]NKJ43699.1 hypothetical protein [Novosphingobium sp. SG720]
MASQLPEVDVIAMAIARALAKQHHAQTQLHTQPQGHHAHRDLRPIQQRPAKR